MRAVWVVPGIASILILGILVFSLTVFAATSDGTVQSFQKISLTEGGFVGDAPNTFDRFGIAVANLGDLDGDGVNDLAVSEPFSDDIERIWILFLNSDGTVKAEQKISQTEGGFGGVLSGADCFGCSLASIGDLDGDNVPDIAVGAHNDNDGGSSKGSVWILFMNSDGTVKSEQKISDTQGGLNGVLDTESIFGFALANLGDFDGDGVNDLAVTAASDLNPTVFILFLNTNGTVKGFVKIPITDVGLGGNRFQFDQFGRALANIGDLNDDGVIDLAVQAQDDTGDGSPESILHILFMNSDGTIDSFARISETEGGFVGTFDSSDQFGTSLAGLGDINDDGIEDLAVGSHGDGDGGGARGAVYILFLNSDGTVKAQQKISDTEGNFIGILDNNDRFGTSLANLGDLNGDGVIDLASGAQGDDDGGEIREGFGKGAVWILFLSTSSVPNSAPNALDDLADTLSNIPVDIDVLVNDSDPDGDPLSIDFTFNGPTNGFAIINAGMITYTSNPSFAGDDSFDYKISDGRGGEATATVTVTVFREDTDEDGIPNEFDQCPNDPNKGLPGIKGCGVSETADIEAALAAFMAALEEAQSLIETLQNTITELEEILQSGEITLCHQTVTKTVNLGSLTGHLAHDDTIGACEP